MKTKTIKKGLDQKFEEFVKTIDDEKVQDLVRRNTVITGGCIASMLAGEPVNDYDLYFKNKETCKAVAQYYVNKFNEQNKDRKNRLGGNGKAFVLDGDDIVYYGGVAGITSENPELAKEFENQGSIISNMIASTEPGQIKIIVRSDGIAEADIRYQEDGADADLPSESVYTLLDQADEIPHSKEWSNDLSYKPIFLSTNAITLSGDIQLIIRFYGEPKDIHANYDFVHCTNYWESGPFGITYIELNKEALESILTKSLYYIGSRYPLCSIIRTRKFIQRGWKITAGEYLKMAMQLNNLDLNNPVVLEDQLVGVDTMYFQAFIEEMRKQMLKDGKEDLSHLDNQYIISVIDKIFN